MGNQVTCSGRSVKKTKGQKPTVKSANGGSAIGDVANMITRSASGAVLLQNSPQPQFASIEILSKTLVEVAQRDEGVSAITQEIFIHYLFPYQTDLGERLFAHLRKISGTSASQMTAAAFQQAVEKLVSIIGDNAILEAWVKIHGEDEDDVVTPKSLRSLLMVSYNLAMCHNGTHYTCPHLNRVIDAVLTSCFHGKESMSMNYVINWMNQNCPMLVQGLHRYVVSVFSTAYRNGINLMSKAQDQPDPGTPILEQPKFLVGPQEMLPKSHVWILSTVLPKCFMLPEDKKAEESECQEMQSENGLQFSDLLLKLAGNLGPSHWTLLYDSNEHGLGSNRFLHHVTGYRGHNLMFIKGQNDEDKDSSPVYCIVSSVEWTEKHTYYGDELSMIIQIVPTYKVIERGPKMLYLNLSIRGYSKTLRAGKDTKNPIIEIDSSFQNVKFEGAPYRLCNVQVWGCGDRHSRENQLDVKKWEVKEAERNRAIKMSASEWLDHPDRYLLELAGRPSYNNCDK